MSRIAQQMPDPEQPPFAKSLGPNENTWLESLAPPSELSMGKSKKLNAGEDAGNDEPEKRDQRRLARATPQSEASLSPNEITIVATAGGMVRSEYDQSEAPEVDEAQIKKLVEGSLGRAERLEILDKIVCWKSWGRAYLAARQEQRNLAAAARNN